jgi:transcriptional regulator with XRE-family HTH domain
MKQSIHQGEYRLFLALLRRYRRQSGLTQTELAERLEQTQSFVSKCERGERRMDVADLYRFCQAMRVSIVDFVRDLDLAIRAEQPDR